jgi:folate-binding protein YgfZ
MEPRDELELLEHGAALVHRDRGHVLTAGDDTWTFLQALVSADLDPLADGDGVASLLLSPQGKLDVAFRLLRVGDDAWLDTDPGFGVQLAASLERFKIRVKADVVDRSAAWGMTSLIGPDVDERLAAPVPDVLHAHTAYGALRAVRTRCGIDLIGERLAVREATASLEADGWPVVTAPAFDAFRIAHGVPLQPADVDERTIPQEAELELDAVSFTKGCFLGQELVCRIDSRGHVNRFLRRLTEVDGDRPVVGAEVVADDTVVGGVTSVTLDGLPPAALGYVRREVAPGAAVVLRWPAGSATARVEALRR